MANINALLVIMRMKSHCTFIYVSVLFGLSTFFLDKVITSFHWRSVAGKAAQDGYETGEQVWKGYHHHHHHHQKGSSQHGFVDPHSRGEVSFTVQFLPSLEAACICGAHCEHAPLGNVYIRGYLQPVASKIFQSTARH